MSVTDPRQPSGVTLYADLLRTELAAQDARKTSFEQRGVAVITTSGTLVTLLFGLAALTTKPNATMRLSHSARDWLFVALVLFVLAAIAAVLVNAPLSYQAVEAPAIKARLKESPVRGVEEATMDVALTGVKALEDAKAKNSIKGWILLFAMCAEVLAVAAVAVAIWLVL